MERAEEMQDWISSLYSLRLMLSNRTASCWAKDYLDVQLLFIPIRLNSSMMSDGVWKKKKKVSRHFFSLKMDGHFNLQIQDYATSKGFN